MDLEARSLQPSIKSELKRISAPIARQATREELLESGMADTLAVS
jgi:vesicle transport through interaction with t-SNAREs 1